MRSPRKFICNISNSQYNPKRCFSCILRLKKPRFREWVSKSMDITLQWQHHTHIWFHNISFDSVSLALVVTFSLLDGCRWMDGLGCILKNKSRRKPNLKSVGRLMLRFCLCLYLAAKIVSFLNTEWIQRWLLWQVSFKWGEELDLAREAADQQAGQKGRLNPEAGCPLVQVFFGEELCCHVIFILFPQMGR